MTDESMESTMNVQSDINGSRPKQQLPESQYFYRLAMQRSAEIKTTSENVLEAQTAAPSVQGQ